MNSFLKNTDNVRGMLAMPSESVDLVLTSPPYDDLRKYGGHDWDFYAVASNIVRVMKEGAVLVWVVGDATVKGSETGSSFEQALHFKRLGLKLWDTMIYQKSGFSFPPQKRYIAAFEYMFVLTKGTPNTFNELLVPKTGHASYTTGTNKRGNKKALDPKYSKKTHRRASNIWKIANHGTNGASDEFAHEHPAIFPEELARKHIESWTNKGDFVLDPFAGSGTTLKVAKLLGRRYGGFEIHADYVAICRKRLNLTTNK